VVRLRRLRWSAMRRWLSFEVYDAVLSPLMFLHGLLAVEFLMTDVALEGPVVPVRALVHLKIGSMKEKGLFGISRAFPSLTRKLPFCVYCLPQILQAKGFSPV